jgi:hypothetical protein
VATVAPVHDLAHADLLDAPRGQQTHPSVPTMERTILATTTPRKRSWAV